VKSLLVKINSKLNAQGGFLKAVSLLAGGTAAAQVITFLALPVLTRLYSPQEFSLLAVFTAILGMGAVIACMRLEVAIPLPEKDEDAASLLILSILCATILSAFSLLLIIIWPHQIAELLGQPQLYRYLWMLPLGIWLSATYSAIQNWATRKKYFSSIAKTKIIQAGMGSSAQIGIGFMGGGTLGLLIGQLMLSGMGIVGLAKRALRDDKANFELVSRKTMLEQLREYDKFPKYSTFESFANTAAIQIPLILIASMAIGPEAGYLLLATKVMSVPLGLIGRAISQVYLSRAAEEYRLGNLGDFTAGVVTNLAKIGIGPLAFIGIVSPTIFPLIFGNGWERAGDLVLWMIPWMILQFIASPISMVMHVRGWQRSMLALTVFGLLLRVSALFIAYRINIESISEWYILSGALFYLICIYIFFKCAGVSLKHTFNVLQSSTLMIGIWAIIGCIIAFIVGYL